MWLMHNYSSNITEMQQWLRAAAAAGFAEGQYELAHDILAGQQGAGAGSDAVNAGDLLRQAADVLPNAESRLAVCEYSGCGGVAVDLESAVTHARDSQATDEEFALIFQVGQDVAFIDEVTERELDEVFDRIWTRRIAKRDAMGIHGVLFYELEYKKEFYPTRRDEEARNPDGTRLR